MKISVGEYMIVTGGEQYPYSPVEGGVCVRWNIFNVPMYSCEVPWLHQSEGRNCFKHCRCEFISARCGWNVFLTCCIQTFVHVSVVLPSAVCSPCSQQLDWLVRTRNSACYLTCVHTNICAHTRKKDLFSCSCHVFTRSPSTCYIIPLFSPPSVLLHSFTSLFSLLPSLHIPSLLPQMHRSRVLLLIPIPSKT